MQQDEYIWKRINLFQSAETTQSYLKNCYNGLDLMETKSYDNCYSFMYYLEQGQTFYKQASLSPLSLKPILLFYGLIHLIKASLLTIDPYYPNSTSVLAHGVSTRKRKKRHYRFFQDEIKVQKYGLCTFFAEQMFHVKHLEGEKFKMADLLALVTELDETFAFTKGKTNMIPLLEHNDRCEIPSEVQECYYMNKNRLKEYLNEKSSTKISWVESESENLIFKKQVQTHPPFRIHIFKKHITLPATLHPYLYLPDMIIHYLILYNLSMISRYETEWWMELIKTTPNEDYVFIHSFLEITEKKCPYLIEQFLFREKK